MKRFILFVFLFPFAVCSFAQRLKTDTVFVFAVCNQDKSDTLNFRYVPKGSKVSWWDNKNNCHIAKCNGLGYDYIILDTAKISLSNILFLSTIAVFREGKDTLQKDQSSYPYVFNVDCGHKAMTLFEFEKLKRWLEYRNEMKTGRSKGIPFQFPGSNTNKDLITEKHEKLERKIAASNRDVDTLPKYYGLKTNFVKNLLNEVNVTFELPIRKNITLDFGLGILYQTSNGYASHGLISVCNYLSSSFVFSGKLNGLDHSYNNRKGFTIEFTPKYFPGKRRFGYLAPQFCYRFYNYHDRDILIDEGDDYRFCRGHQKETSHAFQLQAVIGLQTPSHKRFAIDAFFGLGAMYRYGKYTRESLQWDNGPEHLYDPPVSEIVSKFSVSFVIGLKIGYRFGKHRIN
jgi:hypothetical protein